MVRGSARAHCDSGYWPVKEGRTRFLSARTLLRTRQPARSLSLSFLSALRIPDGGVPRVASPRRIRDFPPSLNGESTGGFGAIEVSSGSTKRRVVPLSFLERTSVSYIQHYETFLRLCRGITLLSPVLNACPRVENLILVRRIISLEIHYLLMRT